MFMCYFHPLNLIRGSQQAPSDTVVVLSAAAKSRIFFRFDARLTYYSTPLYPTSLTYLHNNNTHHLLHHLQRTSHHITSHPHILPTIRKIRMRIRIRRRSCRRQKKEKKRKEKKQTTSFLEPNSPHVLDSIEWYFDKSIILRCDGSGYWSGNGVGKDRGGWR